LGRPAAFLLLTVHLVLSYSHNFLVEPDDDRLWLYTSGIELGRNSGAELNRRVHDSFSAVGSSASQVTRFGLRERYASNYVGASLVHGTAARLVGSLQAARLSDYPAYLARTMNAGFMSMYGVTCLILLVVVLFASDRRWLLAALLAVSATALLESLFDLAGDQWSGLPTLLPDAETRETFAQNLWPNLPALFINPQVQLSPFGDTPRNHFILLMLPLFLLRWRGHVFGSYLFLAGLAFIHQSHTGLVLGCLVAVDAVLRPWIFRSRTAVVMALVLVMFVGRESLGSVIGIARPIVIVSAALAALVIAACIYWGLRGRMGRAAALLARMRERVEARGPVFADLAMIGIILAVSFPVVAAINAVGTEAQSLYFWTQVHGRALGIFRPALMLGLGLFAVGRLDAARGEQRATKLVYAFAALALVPSTVEALMHNHHPIARFEQEARLLDASVGPSIDWAVIGKHSEAEIYYAIARTLDAGR